MPPVWLNHGLALATSTTLGLRVLQLHRLRPEVVESPRIIDLKADYRTRIAYLPATLIPIRRPTSELEGSSMTTNPVQSSLRLLDLQLGQTGPLLIILQFLHAFSVKFC